MDEFGPWGEALSELHMIDAINRKIVINRTSSLKQRKHLLCWFRVLKMLSYTIHMVGGCTASIHLMHNLPNCIYTYVLPVKCKQWKISHGGLALNIGTVQGWVTSNTLQILKLWPSFKAASLPWMHHWYSETLGTNSHFSCDGMHSVLDIKDAQTSKWLSLMGCKGRSHRGDQVRSFLSRQLLLPSLLIV